MKISSSIAYGVIAVSYIAQNCGEALVLTGRIAKEFNLPLAYLQKIMKDLVRANILASKRGPRGGFKLARPASDITLLEIWEAIDGPMQSHLELAQLTKNDPFSLKMEKVCNEATDKARAALAKTKLSRLLS